MSTKTDSAIYAEKPIATYEAQYRENPVAKPQDIELTITAESIHGKAFKVEQIATLEEEVYYSRFANKISDISSISINTYIKDKPIYISFITENATNKNAKDRRRIVVPSLPNPESIVEQIIEIKSKLKTYPGAKTRKSSDASEAKRIADEEFERKYTSEFEPEQVQNTEGLLGNKEKIKREIDFTIDETPAEPAAPAAPAPASAPAEAAAPAAPAPLDAPAPEKKKRPAPIPAPDDIEEVEIELEIETEPEVIAEVPVITAEAFIPEPEAVIETAKIPKAPKTPAPIPEPIPEPTPEPEPVFAVAPAPAPTPTPAPAAPAKSETVSNVSSMSLSDFEAAIKKLKIMHEQGLLTEDEFAAEKRKVLTNLY